MKRTRCRACCEPMSPRELTHIVVAEMLGQVTNLLRENNVPSRISAIILHAWLHIAEEGWTEEQTERFVDSEYDRWDMFDGPASRARAMGAHA